MFSWNADRRDARPEVQRKIVNGIIEARAEEGFVSCAAIQAWAWTALVGASFYRRRRQCRAFATPRRGLQCQTRFGITDGVQDGRWI
jgi:hypothetical protein